MLRLRNNQYINKLLTTSKEMWNNNVQSLSIGQIEWRMENKQTVLGLVSKTGFFGRNIVQLIILKTSKDSYVLFAPASKKDKGIPCFLYDIMDINEFVKRYPIQPVYEDDYDMPLDDLYDELEAIKDKPTRGFIETRQGEPTIVYEIILER